MGGDQFCDPSVSFLSRYLENMVNTQYSVDNLRAHVTDKNNNNKFVAKNLDERDPKMVII